ncbi:MAG: endonuclease/exonuclease/phosphatase family protein [Acidobacteriota bacterium]|nr:endonuclease/exonuclease/phosphatase family protein [Acidobacteriota bacterium]
MLRMFRVAVLTLMTCLATLAVAQQNPTIKIMTQNMDAGTDLGFALYGLQQPDPRPFIDLTLAEVDASGIPERASYLATEIATEMPHIICLQEVTLWRTGATPETATTVRYDQLQLLLSALADAGAHYRVVAVNTLTDLTAPTTSEGPGALRFTDRDVMLARSDLSPAMLQISEVKLHVYSASLSFGSITVRRGFISALARINNQVFRIVDTHLENKFPDVPATAVIQQLQAGELLNAMRNSPQPVILAGDYNADAIYGVNGPGPDNTGTVAYIEAAGYADSWATANPSDQGATWPLFVEDQQQQSYPFFFQNTTPWERIDLIFYNKLQVVSSEQVGAGAGYPDAASDHTGVVSTFQPMQ